MNTLHRHEEERVEEVLQSLRAKGIRITYTRRAVLSYLVASHEHPSAEKIYRDLLPQFPSMSLATVYNNIKVLIDEGVVSEIKVRNDTTTYFDFMGHDHLNVVCEKCGRIADVDIEVPDLREEAASQSGYQITKTQMTVYGICSECQKQ
ncbi:MULTISPECIES: Fur family transcriptional regulator [Streptococcus]|uniref:Fur family transcriptional regulator n=1 Tax=Streptococcus TaxID=1301 RepID=UPI0009F5AE96|nr:Fur family transcriptional regulator [Streptococcus sp. HMSC061E03]MCP9067162.1 transcriptional repressor [Streptococcus parasanguinis]MDU1976477.1 Fur family transcriptional regulator [Streptococcus parasanguinis]